MTEDQDDTSGAPASPQGSLRPGVRLNGMFEIERLIAEGGMGEVYKGVAIASGDAVAIKLVRPDMARHPDVIALFRREAAILHNLLHDAIPRYYVFSVEPELQRAYIAMEFVDGVSLQKRAGVRSSVHRRSAGAAEADRRRLGTRTRQRRRPPRRLQRQHHPAEWRSAPRQNRRFRDRARDAVQ